MVKFSQYCLYRYPIKSMHVLIFTFNYRIIDCSYTYSLPFSMKLKTKQNKKTLSRDIIEVA